MEAQAVKSGILILLIIEPIHYSNDQPLFSRCVLSISLLPALLDFHPLIHLILLGISYLLLPFTLNLIISHCHRVAQAPYSAHRQRCHLL
jgi:hypothetical protein